MTNEGIVPDALLALMQDKWPVFVRCLLKNELDPQVFSAQFVNHAFLTVAIRITGDGEHFRQAVCFPVLGEAQGDVVFAVPNYSPFLLVELPSGLIIAMQVTPSFENVVSINALMKKMSRYIARSLPNKHEWSGISKALWQTIRCRIYLFDFKLIAQESVFWNEAFPSGSKRLADYLWSGLSVMPPESRVRVLKGAIAKQTEHYRQALEGFIDHLDSEVIAALRVGGTPCVTGYNKLLSGNEREIRNRKQVIRAAPLLAHLLVASPRLRRLLDLGCPIWRTYASELNDHIWRYYGDNCECNSELNIPVETIRWIRNKTIDDIGQEWVGKIDELLLILNQFPPEKRPKNREEWIAFTVFCGGVWVGRVGGTVWLKELARLGWVEAKLKIESMHASPADINDIGDLLEETVRAISAELLLAPDRFEQMKPVVQSRFLGISLLKQLRSSLRWHQLQRQPAAVIGTAEIEVDENPPIVWEAPIDEPLRFDSLSGDFFLNAHFLTSAQQLKKEGGRMQHCVSGYTEDCLLRHHNIVSFRKEDGGSVSTADLLLKKEDSRCYFEVLQHRGQENSSPSSQAAEALTQLLVILSNPALQPRLQQMNAQTLEREKTGFPYRVTTSSTRTA